VRANLVRVIDMGPFKYKVDDGLETRKFAYETVYTLLNGLVGGGLNSVEVDTLVDRTMEHVVTEGFKDDGEGIPPILYLLIVRCARQAPGVVDGYVNRLVPGYRGLFERKLPTSAVKQQVEKHRE
ncbi:TATA-binding protein interacting, partial [Piptocephalis cylindrospora]